MTHNGTEHCKYRCDSGESKGGNMEKYTEQELYEALGVADEMPHKTGDGTESEQLPDDSEASGTANGEQLPDENMQLPAENEPSAAEERKANAAIHREEKQDAVLEAVLAERERHNAEMDRFKKTHGIVDGDNGKAAESYIENQVAEISKTDPNVKGFQDIIDLPTANAFRKYVLLGNSVSDAYYLANREQITAGAALAAKKQAVSNVRGKDHLTGVSVRGGGALSVPSDEMKIFRELNPGASDAEITKFYNDCQKT
jgi:hypothetical protein